MVFSSTVFLFLFLPFLLLFYYNPFYKKRAFRNGILLLASLFFYAWGEPFFVFVMIASILINWAFGLLVVKYHDRPQVRKYVLAVSILYNLGLLFGFKYLSFTLRNIDYALGTGFTPDIALPIGISFFTFQLMSYVFDVCKTPAIVQRNPFNVALYLALFPQLIAGPIVRFGTIANEIQHRLETREDFTEGMTRFVFGLGKKVLLANYAGFLADRVFALTDPQSAATAWIGAIAYTMQIYFDFSGYSDMAIGLGRVFGFHFEENFNYPYVSRSITEFWRRWHISLSTWFRDYLYIPLGGSRGARGRTAFNLFVVWLLTGVWHGANWTFIVWGLYYFTLLMAERAAAGWVSGLHPLFRRMGHLYTLFFVAAGWVLFRAESLAAAWRYLGTMFLWGAAGWFDESAALFLQQGATVLIAGLVFSTPFVAHCGRKCVSNTTLRELGLSVSLVLVFALSILACVKNTYNPFIYFNF
jgi:D-alanyl-lipoteichoic acid acyltransferase DltB (MBOAT superfamily)